MREESLRNGQGDQHLQQKQLDRMISKEEEGAIEDAIEKITKNIDHNHSREMDKNMTEMDISGRMTDQEMGVMA